MKKLLHVVLHPVLWAVIGIAALSALIWWVGPLIAIGEWRPLDGIWSRAILIAALVLILVLKLVLGAWRRKKTNAALVDGIAKGPKTADRELNTLNERFTQAIDVLKTAVNQPLRFNQMQLSIPHAPMIAQGVAANMAGEDQSISRDNGLLDYSRINAMKLQAWSPFQAGFFDGVFVGARERYPELNDVLDELAAAHGVTPSGIAVAWIVRHPANIQVVLGTTKPERVREAAAGSDVALSRQEWYRLFTAAGHRLP